MTGQMTRQMACRLGSLRTRFRAVLDPVLGPAQPAVFPPEPAWCQVAHTDGVDDEIGLRLHERRLLRLTVPEYEHLDASADLQVSLERCDVASRGAAAAQVVVRSPRLGAPDPGDVDVQAVTAGFTDWMCRQLLAEYMTGANGSSQTVALGPEATAELAAALGRALIALGVRWSPPAGGPPRLAPVADRTPDRHPARRTA